jgi:D-amino-acid dehydrogenase
MSRSILILGNGVIGRCTAYYAATRGFNVTIVDRNSAAGFGCSFGNAGMIVPSHFVPLAAPGMVKLGLKWMFNSRSPFYVKPRLNRDLIGWGLKFNRSATKAHVERSAPLLRDMNLLSRAAYEELAAVLGDDFFLTKRGLLMLCKTDHALEEESHMADKANSLGIPAEVLDAAGVARVDSAVTATVAGGVYFPKDCHLSPSAFMTSLGRELEKLNVRIIPGTEVTGWRAKAGRVDAVQTSTGELTADEYVLAGGSWSATTIGGLKLKLPMQAGKGYSLTLEHPRQLPEICSIFTEARVAVTPMNGTLRFGGTMEISGLSESISPRRVEGIIQSIPKYYPAFKPEDFTGIQPWVGLRPCSPDGLPYVGRFGKFTNLSAATGHSMMGLSLGPVTGKIMADVLEGTAPPLSIGMLSPDRFA